jgi:hypothetical protein
VRGQALIKTVYIAGPLTQGDVQSNVNLAAAYGHKLLDMGLAPFVPHLAHYMQQLTPRGYEDWMGWCLTWVERCDALLRIAGDSPGADREVARAKELGIPVFTDVSELRAEVEKQSVYDHVVADM